MIRETFLSVQGDTFDVRSVRGDIEAIASCFGEYLAQVGGSGRSKHKALGAVGKALQHARVARGEALLGFARRVHEQTTENTFPAGAVEKLDEGLRKLDDLLGRENVPARAASEILERVDYATYYDVRRRGVEFQNSWKDFVRRSAERLKLTWEKDVPWFSRRLDEHGEPWRLARAEFLAGRKDGALGALNVEEEEKGT